ncbi:MAG: ParB/RepB/Spo0J family partition protein [Candidatus Uhrbacteria bacterium]
MSKTGLGRGLSSLIPNKNEDSPPVVKDQPQVHESEVAIEKVHHNPRQPRQEFDEQNLADLVRSIAKHGILQPLVVSVREDGQYELIAGERRLRAAKKAGEKKVPIVIRTVNDQEKLELALIENIQRADLNPLEEASAYKTLTDEFDLTQDQVSERVGKARSTVANVIRLLELPEDIKQALREGRLSRTHARTLLAEKDPGKQKQLFQAVLGGDMTVREVEARAIGKRHQSGKDPNLTALEQELQSYLGTKVSIQDNGGQGKIIVEYYSREDLKKLKERLS